MSPCRSIESWALSCRQEDGVIVFTDINPCPTLHPASTVYQQAAQAGLSHQALLLYALSQAAERAGLPALPTPSRGEQLYPLLKPAKKFLVDDSSDNQIATAEILGQKVEVDMRQHYIMPPAYLNAPAVVSLGAQCAGWCHKCRWGHLSHTFRRPSFILGGQIWIVLPIYLDATAVVSQEACLPLPCGHDAAASLSHS